MLLNHRLKTGPMIKPKQIKRLNAELGELGQILENKHHLTGEKKLERDTPAYRRFLRDEDYHQKEEKFLDYFSDLKNNNPDDVQLEKIFEAYKKLIDRINPVNSKNYDYSEIDAKGKFESEDAAANDDSNNESEGNLDAEPSRLELLTALGEDDNCEDL